MAKYIRFEKVGSWSGKPIYDIINKAHGEVLGFIKWYPQWRGYVCVFSADTIWSMDCLADVQRFMATLKPSAAPGREPGC